MIDKTRNAVRLGQSSGESMSYSGVNAAVLSTTSEGGYTGHTDPDGAAVSYDNSRPVTAAEVAAIVSDVLSQMRVYVLESDITAAQNAVRGVVSQTYF